MLPQPPTSLACVDLFHEPDPADAAERWQAVRVQRQFTLDHCLYDSALLKLGDAHFFLRPGGLLAFEFGAGQEILVQRLLQKSGGYEQMQPIVDHTGTPRVLVAGKA